MADRGVWWRAWGPVLLWMIAQLTGTSLPGSAIPDIGLDVDDAVHVVIYAGQAALVWRAAQMTGQRWSLGAVLCGLSLFGALDEWHQMLIPGRSATVLDWVMDTLGAAAGLTLGAVMLRTRWAKHLQ